MREDFLVEVVGGKVRDPEDANIDVEVTFRDGRKYSATFFSLANLRTPFEKNKSTGECGGGLYLWARDMIIVESVSLDAIRATIAELADDGELDAAQSRIDDSDGPP